MNKRLFFYTASFLTCISSRAETNLFLVQCVPTHLYSSRSACDAKKINANFPNSELDSFGCADREINDPNRRLGNLATQTTYVQQIDPKTNKRVDGKKTIKLPECSLADAIIPLTQVTNEEDPCPGCGLG
jgi:hypothetical protein